MEKIHVYIENKLDTSVIGVQSTDIFASTVSTKEATKGSGDTFVPHDEPCVQK